MGPLPGRDCTNSVGSIYSKSPWWMARTSQLAKDFRKSLGFGFFAWELPVVFKNRRALGPPVEPDTEEAGGAGIVLQDGDQGGFVLGDEFPIFLCQHTRRRLGD